LLAGALWGAAVAAVTPAEKQDILDCQNAFRCMHGVPDFTWDDRIAANAQAWADKGQYGHSPGTYRNLNGESLGENLAWGYPTRTACSSAQGWYSEIDKTSPRGIVNQFGMDTGHYTQLVWAGSVRVGCGKGRADVSGKSGDFWVCEYGPAGNMQGGFPANVLAPSKTAAECKDPAAHATTAAATTKSPATAEDPVNAKDAVKPSGSMTGDVGASSVIAKALLNKKLLHSPVGQPPAGKPPARLSEIADVPAVATSPRSAMFFVGGLLGGVTATLVVLVAVRRGTSGVGYAHPSE
jgi:hypothetical protein